MEKEMPNGLGKFFIRNKPIDAKKILSMKNYHTQNKNKVFTDQEIYEMKYDLYDNGYDDVYSYTDDQVIKLYNRKKRKTKIDYYNHEAGTSRILLDKTEAKILVDNTPTLTKRDSLKYLGFDTSQMSNEKVDEYYDYYYGIDTNY